MHIKDVERSATSRTAESLQTRSQFLHTSQLSGNDFWIGGPTALGPVNAGQPSSLGMSKAWLYTEGKVLVKAVFPVLILSSVPLGEEPLP